jgi:hypothetical protein
MWVRFPPPALGLPLGEFDGLATYVYFKSKRTYNAWSRAGPALPHRVEAPDGDGPDSVKNRSIV